MDMSIPPLISKNMLESNPLKSRMLVRRLGVYEAHGIQHKQMAHGTHMYITWYMVCAHVIPTDRHTTCQSACVHADGPDGVYFVYRSFVYVPLSPIVNTVRAIRHRQGNRREYT